MNFEIVHARLAELHGPDTSLDLYAQTGGLIEARANKHVAEALLTMCATSRSLASGGEAGTDAERVVLVLERLLVLIEAGDWEKSVIP